jgi:hypothetical protein
MQMAMVLDVVILLIFGKQFKSSRKEKQREEKRAGEIVA